MKLQDEDCREETGPAPAQGLFCLCMPASVCIWAAEETNGYY